MNFWKKLKQKIMPYRDFKVEDDYWRRRIGLSSMFFYPNEGHDESLSGWDDFYFQNAVVEMLDTAWDIGGSKAKASMRQTMEWLRREGHRGDLERFQDEEDPEVYRRALRLDPKDWLAWDVARYAMLARRGFYARYLSQAEALEHLEEAYRMSRSHFQSWRDYAESFIRASEFWHRVQDEELAREFPESESSLIRDIKALLADPQSTWNRVRWGE